MFLAAFESRRRYDLGRPISRPWLLGIATNLAQRHWRTERLRLASIANTAPGGAVNGEDEAVERVDAAAAVSEVSDAVASLDAGCRNVLLLIAWTDLSYAEVAEALDIPIGTVRSRLSRARRKLRRRLAASPLFPELSYPLDTGV